MKKQSSINKPLEALKRVVKEAGSQKAAAEQLNITAQYLCDLLKGRRGFSEPVASALGLRRKIIFEDK